MLIRNVRKFHESLYIGLPKNLADLMGLSIGKQVSIDYKNNAIVITPVIQPASKETGASQTPA